MTAHALFIIKESLNEINQSTLNVAGRKLWPRVVNDFTNFPTIADNVKHIEASAQLLVGKEFKYKQANNVNQLSGLILAPKEPTALSSMKKKAERGSQIRADCQF